MEKRAISRGMLFPMSVSIPIVVGTVVFIVIVMFFVARWQGKTLETIPMLVCGVTMLVAGWTSQFVTRWARSNERYFALGGLIGVTTIMFVPLFVVVITHIVAKKEVAHLVFSYFVVYYLMFLPVGTWLVLPPKPSQGKDKTDDEQS